MKALLLAQISNSNNSSSLNSLRQALVVLEL
jgi:hypothetical protein